MKKNSKTITKCQISGANDLKSIVFLGYLPPPTEMKKINSKKTISIRGVRLIPLSSSCLNLKFTCRVRVQLSI